MSNQRRKNRLVDDYTLFTDYEDDSKPHVRGGEVDFTFNNWLKVLFWILLAGMCVYSFYPWLVELFA